MEKEILNQWIQAKKKIENKEVNLKDSIRKAMTEIYGEDKNKCIDIYADGTISGVIEGNITFFCDEHGNGVHCLKCYPLIRIYGWNVFDYIGINSEDEQGEMLEGSIWDCENKEWVKETLCKENMINEMDLDNEESEAIEELRTIIKSYKDDQEDEGE